ncbi:DUF2690 domain-containing protein [Streptomyces sp. NPDC046182]|uniref:helix-turn-helix domain-containing protein n=1 Tax=Streptomyces sp. NPDC046182 TaxID=3154601 RepID=UPI0033C16913
MARGKVPPDELDPRVGEFAIQLRRLVDRSGLSVAAVADRTGHSRAAWERYLDGRLLAPRGAVVALAEVTGADSGRLTAMREQAERAWSRTEDRREPAAEAQLLSQARSAHGTNVSTETSGSSGGGGHGVGTGAGTGSVSPRRATAPARPGDEPPPAFLPPRRRAVLLLTGTLGALLVIAAAVLLTDLGRTGNGGNNGTDGRGGTTANPSAGATTPTATLPAGVKCTGAGCTGQDPEAMGCGGTFATTVSRSPVGAAGLLEVRHSGTCGAAWTRVTGGAPGDTLTITAGTGAGASQDTTVGADPDAYSPMVAVATATDATACVTRTSGARVCTGGR